MIRNSTSKFLFFLVTLSLSCTNESSIPVGKPSTFIRYFNGGNFDEAQTMLEASDNGFVILANTQVSETSYKIKLIKTDAFGNQMSQIFFPAFTAKDTIGAIIIGGFASLTSSPGVSMTSGIYTNISPVSTTGSGTLAKFKVTVPASPNNSSIILTDVSWGGFDYKVGDKISFNSSQFGGSPGSIDFTINAVAPASFRAYSIAPIGNSGSETGYVITGESIYAGKSQLLAITVDTELSNSTAKIFHYDLDYEVKGVGVTRNSGGNYFVLGQILNAPSSDMFLAELDGSTPSLDTLWTRKYGAGSSTLAKRLFLDNTDQTSLYWGGTAKENTSTDHIRFVHTGFNQQGTYFATPTGSLSYNVTGDDLCEFGFQYAFIGGRADDVNKFDSVFYSIHNGLSGVQGGYKSFPILLKALPGGELLHQTTSPANSICATNDAGLLMLTTMAVDAAETNTDYYLIKTNLNGGLKWAKQYGSKLIDRGAFVMQARDGGYMILGTTTLANVTSIFLMKTDLDGNVQ